MKQTFPADWRNQPCFLASIPRPLVPYVSGLLKIMESPGFWQSDTDYLHGYTAVTELERCLMTTCLDVLLQQNDALYRLLNTSLLGVSYTTVTEDPLVVSPAITAHVNLDIHDEDSIIGRLDRLNKLLDNSINGTVNDIYTDTDGLKQKLQAILDAMASDETDIGTIITDLELVIGALA